MPRTCSGLPLRFPHDGRWPFGCASCAPSHSLAVAELLVVDGSAHMNPFTTDHPLAAKSSWFDTREHPVLSFVCSALVLGLILTPVVLVRLYYGAISDIGAEPNPFPQPWWALFWGVLIAFVLSLFVALPAVLLLRLLLRRGRRRYAV